MKIALLSLMFLLGVPTIEVEGVQFERSLKSANQNLRLAGASGFTYALIFDVLSGAIYLPEGTQPRDFPIATDKALVLSYKRSFSAEELREVTSNLFRRNTPATLVKEVEEDLQAFNALYQDIQPGDRYRLTLSQGQGLELSLNGQPIGSVKSPKFGMAVFNIWFGENPFNSSFRDQLLKGI